MKMIIASLSYLLLCSAGFAQVHGSRPGISFQIKNAYDPVYEGTLTYLKKTGHEISTNNREAGQIMTYPSVHNGMLMQVGFFIYVSFIRENKTTTTVNVEVEKVKRAAGNRGWASQKQDAEQTHKVEAELKEFLETSLASQTDSHAKEP